MKAINKLEHQFMLHNLKQVHKLLDGEVDNFIQNADLLCKLYQQYQNLITELSVCITEYQLLHHELKVKVLAPALRKSKKRKVA